KASTTEEFQIDIREEIQKIAEEQLNILNINQWNEFIKNVDNYQDNLLANINIKEMIINLVTGNYKFDWREIYENFGKAFFAEIKLNLTLMAKIFAIAIFTGILSNFKTNFTDSTVGELAWIVCYIMIVVLIIQSITVVLNVGKNTIEQMTSFMQILFPPLLAL